VSDFTYLSLGAGVQSSALLVCSALGLHNVPKADIVIFADTGDEPQYVYSYLDTLEAWTAGRIPIRRAKHANGMSLSEAIVATKDTLRRCAMAPFYVAKDGNGKEGMLRRQCTTEYKIDVIHRTLREELGIAPRQPLRTRATALIGISVDEAHRMKPARHKMVLNTYPLVDANLTRRDCERIVLSVGLPKPQKSACIMCPYHSDAWWHNLKANHPVDFDRAVRFDLKVRNLKHRGAELPVYVHRSCQPLDQVDFDPMRDQIDMFGNECEGMCGV